MLRIHGLPPSQVSRVHIALHLHLHLLPLLSSLQDIATVRRAKRRVFQLAAAEQLQSLVDVSHGFRGVEQIPDAVEYMLRGGHIGKVVIPLLPSNTCE